jgi:Transglycosylase SLT domain
MPQENVVSVPAQVLQWRNLVAKYVALHPILTVNDGLSILWSESTGRPNAVNPPPPAIPRDRGLFQIEMPEATMYGGITDPEQLFDPETNIRTGMAFPAHLKQRFGAEFPTEWSGSYNCGETKFAEGFHDEPYFTRFNQNLAILESMS